MHLPLAAGVNTKPDPRALPAPGLAVCRDAQFDELGGIQTRKPFANLGSNILGGGTVSNVRRVVSFGDELLLFTKTALYSWSASDSAWVSKGTYLAPKLDEKPVFVRTSEQVECDRAELNNVIVYAWKDVPTGSTSGVYVAAADKTTGAVLLAPTAVGTSSSRPRLLALTSVIHLYYVQGTELKGLSISPTSLASTVGAAATTIGTAVNTYYDACVVSNSVAIAYRRSVTTSYEVKLVTAALSVTASTKVRTCDGVIAIAYEPNNSRLQIVRTDGSNPVNFLGDLLNSSTLADVYTDQALGAIPGSTTNDQLTAAFRSVADSSNYRCYVFWSNEASNPGTTSQVYYNYVDTANNIGTAAASAPLFVHNLGIGSRAFDHEGSVYVWLTFAKQSTVGSTGFKSAEQNSYILMSDTVVPHAKACTAKGGGYQTVGYLPGVQSLGSGQYAWCGIERRIIKVGTAISSTGYSARAPRDIVLTFDSDAARRCARLGDTLYVSGGQIIQYDGEGIAEVGFHIYPFYFNALASSGGSMDAGTYTHKGSYRWDNAKGERERSTTATTDETALTANQRTSMTVANLPVTRKTGTRSTPAIEIWRTTANPTIDAPFYLVTDQDPANTGLTENAYLANSTGSRTSSLLDDIVDSALTALENHPENGGILENLSPPAASIVAASQERLFIAGIPGLPFQIAYSKLRSSGDIASFHDALVVDLPADGGPITALSFLDDTLIAFKETAVYAIPGDGFDNSGSGQNYGPARKLSDDVGAVSAESVAQTPNGLIFKSSKGWYMLPRGGVPEYIGDKVAAFDSDTVKAVNVVEAQHQVRCLTGSRMLVWDYLVNEWSEWTIADGLGACVWNGTHTYAFTTGAKSEQSSYSSLTYGLDLETAWIKLADLQGFGAVRWLMVLGEYRSTHALRIRIAYNYAESDASGATWVDDKSFTVTPTTVGGPLQLRHGPKRHRVEAIKIRLTAHTVGVSGTPPTGEALKLTGLGLEVGFEPGLFRRLPAAQKQ